MTIKRLINFFLESISMIIFVFLLQKTAILISIAKRFVILIRYSLIDDISQQNCESLTTSLRFGLDFKKIDIESIFLMQDTWWVVFLLLNGMMIWNLSKNILKLQYFSLNDVREHLRKNVLCFLILAILCFYSITSISFFLLSDTSVFLISNQTQYFDENLVSKLKEMLQIRKIISVMYLIVLLLLLIVQEKKSSFWIAVTWYFGWHLISSLFLISGLTFDTFIFLYLRESLPVETLIEMISFFPFFAAAFCMERNPNIPQNPDVFNKPLETKIPNIIVKPVEATIPNIIAKPLEVKTINIFPQTKILDSAPNYASEGIITNKTNNKNVPITGITSKEEYLRLSKIYNPCGNIVTKMANCHEIAKPTVAKSIVQWAYPPSKEGFDYVDKQAVGRCQMEVLNDLEKCMASAAYKNIPKK